jgi:hypothetical protein
MAIEKTYNAFEAWGYKNYFNNEPTVRIAAASLGEYTEVSFNIDEAEQILKMIQDAIEQAKISPDNELFDDNFSGYGEWTS